MSTMERGTKRLCASCAARFYDLGHAPIHCPKCDAIFVPPEPPPLRQSRMPRNISAAKLRPAPVEVEKSEETEEAEATEEADDVLLLDEVDEDAPEKVDIDAPKLEEER